MPQKVYITHKHEDPHEDKRKSIDDSRTPEQSEWSTKYRFQLAKELMKKRTKKKIWKYTKKSIVWTFSTIGSIVTWIFSKLWKATKWSAKKTGESVKEQYKKSATKRKEKEKQGKPLPGEPHYQEFSQIKKFKGSFKTFENYLLKNKSTIGIILGARGTGKSAIGMSILENFAAKTEKKIYALGFKKSAVPKWIEVIKDIEDIENNAILLIDEGGIEFSSRDAMSNANKLLSKILLIARHKDLSVMFISQNSSNLEINAIRQADYLLLKPSSLLQKDFERKKIKQIYEEAQENFEDLKGTEGLTYVYADKFRGFVTNKLPSFWSEKVSKGYSKR